MQPYIHTSQIGDVEGVRLSMLVAQWRYGSVWYEWLRPVIRRPE